MKVSRKDGSIQELTFEKKEERHSGILQPIF